MLFLISLFLSVMPYHTAVYIIDCFFYEGAKVRDQILLLILDSCSRYLLLHSPLSVPHCDLEADNNFGFPISSLFAPIEDSLVNTTFL